jgi:hypothetical protein
MRKPPPTRGAGGLGRELAARLRVEAERERRIAEIVREHAARGLRADVLGDGTADCPFLILTEPLSQPSEVELTPRSPQERPFDSQKRHLDTAQEEDDEY